MPTQSEIPPRPPSRTFAAFNTVNTVSLCGISEERAAAIFDAVERRCAYYERLFSHMLPESSLMRVNTAQGAPVEVESELAELVSAALEYCEATDGLFDITMGPVIALWDFHQQESTAACRIPEQDRLAQACSHVGWRGVRARGNTIQLDDPQASIALGGVAKGYIADALVALMRQQGAEHGMVNLGGNVAVFGGRPEQPGALRAWNVGIRVPRASFEGEESSFAAVQLMDGSVVTSGVYERSFTAPNGVLYHHILDPATGMPAETDLAAVSLVSQRSLDGDGYTTALVAMGLDRARAFVEGLDGCEAVFVTQDYQVYGTSGIGTAVPFVM